MKKSKKGFGLVSAIIITMVIVTFLLALLTAASMGVVQLRNHTSEMQASLKSKCALELAKAYYLNTDVDATDDFSELLIINYKAVDDKHSTYDVPESIRRKEISGITSIEDELFDESRQALSYSVVEVSYEKPNAISEQGKLKFTAYTKYDGMSLNIEMSTKASCTYTVSLKTVARNDEITYRFDEIETYDIVNSIDDDNDRYRYVTIHVKPAVGSDLVPYIYVWTSANKSICTWVPPVHNTVTVGNSKYYDYTESKNTAGPTAAMEYEGNGWYKYTVKFDTYSDFGTRLNASSEGKFSAVIAEKGSVKNVPQSMLVKVNGETAETPPAREDTQTFDLFDLPVSTLRRSDVYITLNSEYFYNPSNYDGFLDSLTTNEMKELLDKSYTAYIEDNYVNINARIAGVSDESLPLTLEYDVNGVTKSSKMVYQGYGWYKLIIKGYSPTSFTLKYNGSGNEKKTKAVADQNTHELYLVSGRAEDYNLRAFQSESAANDYFVNTLYDKYAADYSTVNIKIPNATSSTSVSMQAEYISDEESGDNDTSKMTVYFEVPTGWGITKSSLPKIVSVGAALGVSGDYEAAMEYCAEDIYAYTFEYSEEAPLPSQIYFSNNGANNIAYRTVNISISQQCSNLIYKVNSYSYSNVSKVSIYYLLDPATASGGWYEWDGTLKTTNGKFIYVAVANVATYNNLTLQVKYTYNGQNCTVGMTQGITSSSRSTFRYYYAVIPSEVEQCSVYYKTSNGKNAEMTLTYDDAGTSKGYKNEDRVWYLYQNNFGKDKNVAFGGISPSTVDAGDLSSTTTVVLKSTSNLSVINKAKSEKTASSGTSVTGTLVNTKIADGYKRIYFYASSDIFSNWGNIKAYAYNTEQNEWKSWQNSSTLTVSNGMYYIDIPKSFYYVIFRSDDGSKQTPTLTVSGNEKEYIACAYNSGAAYCTKLIYRTVYFLGNSSYSNAYAYYWNKDKAATKWNGVKMTKCSGNVYKVLVPISMKNIIFNNGSSQTADLTVPEASTKNAYDITSKKWVCYNTPAENYLSSSDSYNEKTQLRTSVAKMILNSGYKTQYYDVKKNGSSYGTIDGDRNGTCKTATIYDWYTYKIGAKDKYSVKFVISNGSAKYATVALSNLYSDVYINVNSYNSIDSSNKAFVDDISLYTINPERENTATGTVIYFNNLAGWGTPKIKYADINGEHTEKLKYNSQDSIWYYEVPVNCTYFTFISGDGTQATGRYSITNGVNYYNNGGNVPGVFKTQSDKLSDAINNAIGVLNTCGLYQISGGEYFVSEQNPPKHMKYLAQKIVSAQAIFEKGYDLGSSGTSAFNNTALAVTELTSLTNVTQALYKQIKSARVYIDNYPESKALPEEYIVDEFSKKLIAGVHDEAVKLYDKEYSNNDAACKAIKTVSDKLEQYLTNIQLSLKNCIVVVLQNNAQWNTDLGKIYIVINDNATELNLLNADGYYTYLYKYTGDIQNSQNIHFEYRNANSSGGVTNLVGSNLLDSLPQNYEGQTWIYDNAQGEWKLSTAGDTYVVAADKINQSEISSAYISNSATDEFKVYFKHDTTVTFGKYTDRNGKVKYDKYTYVIYSGEYDLSKAYRSGLDLFTINAMNYFSNPLNYGFESVGSKTISGDEIGLTDNGKITDDYFYDSYNYTENVVNILVGGSQKTIDGNIGDKYTVNTITLDNGDIGEIDLWAEAINFRWVTGEDFELKSDEHIEFYSNKVSVAAESIAYHSGGSDFNVGKEQNYNYLIVKNNIEIIDLDGEENSFTIKTGTYRFFDRISLLDYDLWKNNTPVLVSLSTSSSVDTQDEVKFSNLEGEIYDN